VPTLDDIRKAKRELDRKVREAERLAGVKTSYRDRQSDILTAKRRAERIVMVPACADPERRARLEADDIAWLMWYFAPESGCETPFTYDFTFQQREMIAAIRHAIEYGGDQSLAASRGEGKTTLFERMLLKYTLTGRIKFSVLLQATGAAAADSLEAIKWECETNDRLHADYPEVCVPVRALENTPQRAHTQLASGNRPDNGQAFEAATTKFLWCGQEITFPKVPGSLSAGAIIATRGLDSAIRGIKKRGRRPDVVGIDDPDTEETARSQEQSQKLEDRIDRTIAALGGQKRRVARVMLTTLQNRTCVSYRFTDSQAKPSWHPRRFKFLVRRPDRMDLWGRYVELRKEDWRNVSAGVPTAAAHEFYVLHREEMDAGAEVANPNRYTQGELSALQFYFDEVARIGQEAVATEYDNDPPDVVELSEMLSASQIAAKLNGYPRGLVPSDATHVTAFIDVQQRLLYYAVCAWRQDFTGYVIEYGAWPKQDRSYFTLGDAAPAIPDVCRGGLEAGIHAALDSLTSDICGRPWPVDGGGEQKISRCLIDANWGQSTSTVYAFVRQSLHAAVLLPTHGRGVRASQSPIMLWQKKQGEQVGLNWRVRRTTESRAPVRHGIYDTNFWKSFLHQRLYVPLGGSGCLSLFKAEPAAHRMLADHLHAEYPVSVESLGRKVSEWQVRPNHPDNHWFDCLVGCAVAASIEGCSLKESAEVREPRRERKTLAEMAAQARAGR
jgi:hypothetical protein